MIARQIAQPQCQIGEFWKPLTFIRVCTKTRRIDENFSPIEAAMENIAEQFGRVGRPPFRCQDVDAESTAEFSININSKDPGVECIIIAIDDTLRLRRRDQTAVQIGS